MNGLIEALGRCSTPIVKLILRRQRVQLLVLILTRVEVVKPVSVFLDPNPSLVVTLVI